jgi:valyl-tRNA synthetase
MITVITNEGTMADNTPEAFRGLDVLEARKKTVTALEEQGVLVKTEDYTHNVGHCYKCGTVIQPLLREQWFVDVEPLAKKAIETLEANKIVFYPESKKEQLITYLKNIHDWNISRQIAWGIPIPAFQNVDDKDDWIYDERVDQETILIDGKTYRRDPDVFDTWFSSSTWPYTTLNYGNPDSTDFDDFYPLSVMETGFDILYPWVSRMLMLGLYTTGEVPFKAVYLNGLVLDEHGQKMSKSKGNVIDPMTVLDEYGSDAFRMGVISGMSAGNNQPFAYSKVIGARNFCNKVWNIARYIEDKTQNHHVDTSAVVLESDVDHWFMGKLDQAVATAGWALNEYRFSEAYETIYHFVWDDFADWYLEASKAEPNLNLLAYALESILRLAHPFAPFVTETIWQTLGWQQDELLVSSLWPVALKHDKQRAAAFEAIKELVADVRAVAKNVGLQGGTLLYASAVAVEQNAGLIKQLTRLDTVKELEDETGGLKLTQTVFDCWLDIDAETAQRYRAKLDEQHAAEAASVKRLAGRLSNKSYVDHAPEAVVTQTREQLEIAQARLESIAVERKRFSL